MYVFVYCREKRSSRVNLRFSIFGEKRLCHETLTFYSFCFSLCLEVTCSRHVLHLWYRGKWPQLRKPLLYYLVYIRKDKQLHCENYFYYVFITAQGNDHVIKTLKTFFHLFLRKFIYLTIFHSISIFNGFIELMRVCDIICINLPVWLI